MQNRALLSALIIALTTRIVLGADFTTEMMDATFRWVDKYGVSSTCFLVRREAPDTAVYLVTTAHSFNGVDSDSAVIILRKPKADGSYERHEHPIPFQRDGKALWVRHEKQDVAILRISEPLPVPVAALPVSMVANEARLKASAVQICSPLFILGYPQRLEADSAGLPMARQGIFASSPQLPLRNHPTFLADLPAYKGNSGGPVFIQGADNHPLIVGVVVEDHFYSDNLKSRYKEQVINTPLGVGGMLHAQYLLDTLELAAKQVSPP